jgi:hypothetical protein
MRIRTFRLFLAAILLLLFAIGAFGQAGGPIITTVAGNGLPSGVLATSTGIGSGYGSIAVDPFGNLFIADSANYVVRKVNQNGVLTVVAGNGTSTAMLDLGIENFGNPGKVGDGGPAVNAEFEVPFGVAADGGGNLYISDLGSLIRKLNLNGIITTVAGTGVSGFSGDGGPAVSAQISVISLAADNLGNIYIADGSGCRIRKVSTLGIITTVAGNGTCGFSGDGGQAISAKISAISVAADSSSNIYIADGSNRIRKINVSGVITTIAGNGTLGFTGDGGPAISAQISPGAVAVGNGNVFFADGNGTRIRKVNSSGVINTVAGTGTGGFSGDGGPATSAQIYAEGLAADTLGNLFIETDSFPGAAGDRIRKVNSGGTISTYAGNDTLGYSGDNTTATNTAIDNPSGIAVDLSGNLYVGDWNNYRLRKVNPVGQMTTIAGTGTLCYQFNNSSAICGDGGPATSAPIGPPFGIITDANGNLYYSEDTYGCTCVRKIDSGGVIHTVAGGGTSGLGDGGPATSASLTAPAGLVLDANGNLYIADYGSYRVRKVNTFGIITTIAGNGTAGFSGDGGPATSAELSLPSALAFDSGGNLYIGDDTRVRKVAANGTISTIAGNGVAGFSGDGGLATSAELALVDGVAVDKAGNVYITDGNNRVRKVNTQGVIATIAGQGTIGFSGDGGPPGSAEFSHPGALAIDGNGNLFIGDVFNYRVREIAAAGVPNCTLSAAPTTIVAGQSVTATLLCTATANDSLNAAVTWGDGSSNSTSSETATGGSATFTFTHTYGTASLLTYSLSATAVDTMNDLPGTVSPASVSVSVLASGSDSTTFTVFDIPGAGTSPLQGTVALSINAAGAITGTYADTNGVFHGFVRAPNGTITLVDAPDAGRMQVPYEGSVPGNDVLPGTVPISINTAGDITGIYGDTNGYRHGFVRTAATGTIIEFDVPGATTNYYGGTEPFSIDTAGDVTGFYETFTNTNGIVKHGFVRFANGTFVTFDVPGAGMAGSNEGTAGLGINSAGAITGTYTDANETFHGFIRAANGTITAPIDVPGAGASYSGLHGPSFSGTIPFSIDTAGDITGVYVDTLGRRHGFVRTADGTITAPIDAPGVASGTGPLQGTEPFSINASGVTTGTYADANGVFHGFVRAANGTITAPIDIPGAGTIGLAPGTVPFSINTSGVITGTYADASGVFHGFVTTPATPSYLFVPVAPCRIVDTRNANGPFEGPSLVGGSARSFPIPSSSCGIPSTAAGYSLNATVVPLQSLGYLTIWPTGEPQPLVSTLNSLDGRVKANAVIVSAGTGGAVSVFATDPTNVVLDINGYFVPAANAPTALAFYPVTPCRLVDTRVSSGALAGPSMAAGQTRSFPLLAGPCNVPSTAQAYALNFTAVPQRQLGYLTVWPAGQAQPLASTLNALTGTVTANAAIIPAGSGGAINAFVTDQTDLIIDINGYFAPPGPGGLSFYPLAPCRVLDTRQTGSGQPFSGTLNVNVSGSACGVSTAGQAYVFNATVVPPGPLGYLTLWPEGAAQPFVSTLNALDGSITSNMAIVPAASSSVSAYASDPTQLILDISGYFAP